MKMNLTNELSNLLFFTGETATAIRMYSCYAKNSKEFTPQDSLDLMFLSDILHYFSELHFQIIKGVETGEYSPLIETCKRIISQFNDLTDEKIQAKFYRSAIPTFTNPQNYRLVDLKLAIGTLESIIEKCENFNISWYKNNLVELKSEALIEKYRPTLEKLETRNLKLINKLLEFADKDFHNNESLVGAYHGLTGYVRACNDHWDITDLDTEEVLTSIHEIYLLKGKYLI